MLSMFKEKRGFAGLFNRPRASGSADYTEASVRSSAGSGVAVTTAGNSNSGGTGGSTQLSCHRCNKKFTVASVANTRGYSCPSCDYCACPFCRVTSSEDASRWVCCVCTDSRRNLMFVFGQTRQGAALVGRVLEYCDMRSKRLLRSLFPAVTPVASPSPVFIRRPSTSASAARRSSHADPASSKKFLIRDNDQDEMGSRRRILVTADDHRLINVSAGAADGAVAARTPVGTPRGAKRGLTSPRSGDRRASPYAAPAERSLTPLAGKENSVVAAHGRTSAKRTSQPTRATGLRSISALHPNQGSARGRDTKSATLASSRSVSASSPSASLAPQEPPPAYIQQQQQAAETAAFQRDPPRQAPAAFGRSGPEPLAPTFSGGDMGGRDSHSAESCRSESPAPRFPSFTQFLGEQQQASYAGGPAAAAVAAHHSSAAVNITVSPDSDDGGAGDRLELGTHRRSTTTLATVKTSSATPRGTAAPADSRKSSSAVVARHTGSLTPRDGPSVTRQLRLSGSPLASQSPLHRGSTGVLAGSAGTSPLPSARGVVRRGAPLVTRTSGAQIKPQRRPAAGTAGGAAAGASAAAATRRTGAGAGGANGLARQNSRGVGASGAFARTASGTRHMATTSSGSGGGASGGRFGRQASSAAHLAGSHTTTTAPPAPQPLARTPSSANHFTRKPTATRRSGSRGAAAAPATTRAKGVKLTRTQSATVGGRGFGRTPSSTAAAAAAGQHSEAHAAPFTRTKSASAAFTRTKSATNTFARTKSSTAFARTASSTAGVTNSSGTPRGLAARRAAPQKDTAAPTRLVRTRSTNNTALTRSATACNVLGRRSGSGPRPAKTFSRTLSTTTPAAAAGAGAGTGRTPATAKKKAGLRRTNTATCGLSGDAAGGTPTQALRRTNTSTRHATAAGGTPLARTNTRRKVTSPTHGTTTASVPSAKPRARRTPATSSTAVAAGSGFSSPRTPATPTAASSVHTTPRPVTTKRKKAAAAATTRPAGCRGSSDNVFGRLATPKNTFQRQNSSISPFVRQASGMHF